MEAITLRDARKRRNLTQKQLEALSGVPQTNISAIERGVNQDLYLSTAKKLARALRISVERLHFAPEIGGAE